MSDGLTDKRGRHLINFLVDSPEGTSFLSSVDVSSKIQDARMLADLFEEKIDLIGREHVFQVVTYNGANFNAAGGLLSRHGRLLAAMREKTQGRDLVGAEATRFVTAVLTLQSLNKNQDALRASFGCVDWVSSNLAKTVAGKKVHDTVMSTKFWKRLEECILASLPLLQVLRIIDRDEKPAMTELCAAMDFAKNRIKIGLENKQRILKKVLGNVDKHRETQMEMEVDLYRVALFLRWGKFFDIKKINMHILVKYG